RKSLTVSFLAGVKAAIVSGARWIRGNCPIRSTEVHVLWLLGRTNLDIPEASSCCLPWSSSGGCLPAQKTMVGAPWCLCRPDGGLWTCVTLKVNGSSPPFKSRQWRNGENPAFKFRTSPSLIEVFGWLVWGLSRLPVSFFR